MAHKCAVCGQPIEFADMLNGREIWTLTEEATSGEHSDHWHRPAEVETKP